MYFRIPAGSLITTGHLGEEYIKQKELPYCMKIKGKVVILDKILNNLDKLVIDFVNVLKRHTDYVLVSGYVAILFGRSRISEDIDILIPKIDEGNFKKLYKDLSKEFWCINEEEISELFELLQTKHSIRFARKKKVIPNIELKFADSLIDKETLKEKAKVKIRGVTLFISPIEIQIPYKLIVLGSEKDKEDALHLKEVFKGHVSEEKIKYYESLIKEYGK